MARLLGRVRSIPSLLDDQTHRPGSTGSARSGGRARRRLCAGRRPQPPGGASPAGAAPCPHRTRHRHRRRPRPSASRPARSRCRGHCEGLAQGTPSGARPRPAGSTWASYAALLASVSARTTSSAPGIRQHGGGHLLEGVARAGPPRRRGRRHRPVRAGRLRPAARTRSPAHRSRSRPRGRPEQHGCAATCSGGQQHSRRDCSLGVFWPRVPSRTSSRDGPPRRGPITMTSAAHPSLGAQAQVSGACDDL